MKYGVSLTPRQCGGSKGESALGKGATIIKIDGRNNMHHVTPALSPIAKKSVKYRSRCTNTTSLRVCRSRILGSSVHSSGSRPAFLRFGEFIIARGPDVWELSDVRSTWQFDRRNEREQYCWLSAAVLPPCASHADAKATKRAERWSAREVTVKFQGNRMCATAA